MDNCEAKYILFFMLCDENLKGDLKMSYARRGLVCPKATEVRGGCSFNIIFAVNL